MKTWFMIGGVVAAFATGWTVKGWNNDAKLKRALEAEREAATERLIAKQAELDERAADVAKAIDALPRNAPSTKGRMSAYVPNLIKKTLADLE